MDSVNNFYDQQVAPRAREAKQIPLELLKGSGNLIAGAFFQTTGLLTLGQVRVLKDTEGRLGRGSTMLADVFERALRTLNPRAKGFGRLDLYEINPTWKLYYKTAEAKSKTSDTILTKRVIAIVEIPLLALATVFDMVVGAAALPLSILCAGTCPRLNFLAERGLMSPRIIPVTLDRVRYIIAGEY